MTALNGFPPNPTAVKDIALALEPVSINYHETTRLKMLSLSSTPSPQQVHFPQPFPSIRPSLFTEPDTPSFCYAVSIRKSDKVSYGARPIIEGVECVPGWVVDKKTSDSANSKNIDGVRYVLLCSPIPNGGHVTRLTAMQRDYDSNGRKMLVVAYMFRKLERWPLVSGLARIPPGMQSSPPSASSPPHTPTAEPPDDVERNNPSGGLEDSQLLSTSNQMRAKLRNRSSGGVQKRLAHTQASANAIRRPRQQATQDPDPTPHLTFALPSTPKPVKTLPSSSSSRLMQMPGDGSNAVGAPLDLNSLVAAVTNGNAVNVNTHHTFNFYL